MTFEKGIEYLVSERFINDNPEARITDGDVELYIGSRSNPDCSSSLYLIVNANDYSYAIYMFNYNPFFNPLIDDKEDTDMRLKEFFEKQYLFAASNWEII